MSSKKNTTRAALAALVAAATLVSPFSAYAGEGGGGSGTGTGSGDGTAGGVGKVSWVYKDNYGTPTRDNAIAAMQSAGVKNLGGTESNKAIDDAVNNANAECVARSQAAGSLTRSAVWCPSASCIRPALRVTGIRARTVH